MKRIMTKVKYLSGQMLRFIRRISIGRKVPPLFNDVLVHHGNYLHHSIITFSLKRSKRGMASILIGSRSIPFLGNRRHNATVVRTGPLIFAAMFTLNWDCGIRDQIFDSLNYYNWTSRLLPKIHKGGTYRKEKTNMGHWNFIAKSI